MLKTSSSTAPPRRQHPLPLRAHGLDREPPERHLCPHAGVAEPHHATATISDVVGERDQRSLLALRPMTSDV
jgi:hypothetical protein